MSTNLPQLKNIIEAALLAADQPLSIDRMLSLFIDSDQPSREELKQALELLGADCKDRGIELKEVSSGYRLQVKTEIAPWVARLWDERPSRYSRALLETLVLIAYRQPVTRADIEDVRGVSVSSYIIKTLLEREWIRVLGHREVPGRPSLYGTTRQFLDYFNLKSLSELPTLDEIKDLDDINASLNFGDSLPELVTVEMDTGVPVSDADSATEDNCLSNDQQTQEEESSPEEPIQDRPPSSLTANG